MGFYAFLYFRCIHEGCDKKFFSSNLLNAHLKLHMKKQEIVCEFEGCGKKFDKQCRLRQHMRSHTGEKPYLCTVEVSTLSLFVFFSTSAKTKVEYQMDQLYFFYLRAVVGRLPLLAN